MQATFYRVMLERGAQHDLLQRYAPVLRMDARELFLPIPVDAYVEASVLHLPDGSTTDSVTLAELDHRWPPGSHLRFVSVEERRAVVSDEIRRTARKLLSPRLGRVGLFGRVLDALFLLSIFLRPTTPRRTTTAAATKMDRIQSSTAPVCYGRAFHEGEWLVLHYAYFYAMNDWRSSYRGVNDHEGDWEQTWVYCDPATERPEWVAASSHDLHGADLRRHWSDPELVKLKDRPVLFPGAGSHAMYFQPGDYVTRIDVPSLRWLLRAQRWSQRWLGIIDEATERGLGPALGAPFVDAASGDGPELRDWDLRVMDVDDGWLGSFRGMWGFDTRDRTGGERGPSGPKFDRTGDIRSSWADPLGFAGLHGSPPPSAMDNRINQAKVDQVIETLNEEIRQRARLLPLAEQTGSADDMAGDSARLTSLLRQRSELVDLRGRIERGDGPAIGLRDHLRGPAVPLPPPAASGWLLAGWAALSVPLLLTAVALVLLIDEARVAVALIGAGAVALLLEQLFRRRLRALVRLLVLEILLALFVIFALGVAVTVSRYAAGAALVVAAIVLFIANLGELRAVQHYRSAQDPSLPDREPVV